MMELAKAIAKAQETIGAAHKSSTNPHFKSKYADLSEVWSAWQEVGPKLGLSVIQMVKVRDDGKQILVSRLLHSSGDFIDSEMLILPTKPDMQGIGSAITYCRRYALAALVGIVQDDDDGNAASKPANDKTGKPEPVKADNATKQWVDGAIAKLEKGEMDYSDWQASNAKHILKLEQTDPAQHKRLMEFLTGTKEAA